VPFVATSTTVAFVLRSAARDGAVGVNDERAGTRHAPTLMARPDRLSSGAARS